MTSGGFNIQSAATILSDLKGVKKEVQESRNAEQLQTQRNRVYDAINAKKIHAKQALKDNPEAQVFPLKIEVEFLESSPLEEIIQELNEQGWLNVLFEKGRLTFCSPD